MKSKFTRVCGTSLLMLMATACGTSTPLQPTTGSDGSSKSRSLSVTVPQSVAAPADGAQILFASQPVTLVIGNAVSTASAAPTYTFDVATDSGFSTIVYTKSGVAQGADGQTSLTIEKLKSATTYFWRARAVSGDTVGPAPQAKTFIVGPEVVLQTPVLASPANNGTSTGTSILSVTNVQRSGPVTQITYQFDLSDSSSFGNILFTSKVTEQSGSATSVTVNATLVSNNTYFWRVQASDAASGVSTAFSSTSSFRFIGFDPTKAIFVDNPPDVGSWAETAKITYIDTSGQIVVDFDRRTGPGGFKWPESGFGHGGIQYTLGMCLNINNQWYCSAAIQFWEGRELEAGGRASEVGINWYYDARWGAMIGHQPAQGEQVAIFVAQGNLRDSGNTSVKERSNFVVIPFGGSYQQ
jgi:hypothetical protein